jgi:hypothetical protein
MNLFSYIKFDQSILFIGFKELIMNYDPHEVICLKLVWGLKIYRINGHHKISTNIYIGTAWPKKKRASIFNSLANQCADLVIDYLFILDVNILQTIIHIQS